MSDFSLKTRRLPKQARAVAAIEAILDATVALVGRDGFDKATTTAIATEAGVAVGTVYHYFPNKDELIAAAATRQAERMVELVQKAAFAIVGAPLEQAIHRLCDALVGAHEIDAAFNRELVGRVPQVGMEYWPEMQRFAETMVRGLLGAHADAIARDDLDTAAFVLVGMVQGITYTALLSPNPPPTERLREETVAAVLGYLQPRSQPEPGEPTEVS